MTDLVSICLCTYHRPGLALTLQSLSALRLPDTLSLEIVIADNDANGSGASIVEAARKTCPFPITYDIEPVQGLSQARNKTLGMARGDWLAFMDDDEVVDPDWIAELYRTAIDHNAEVAVGVVEPRFETEPPAWVRQGRFFDRSRLPTGTPMQDGRTCNALVRAEIVRKNDIRFDPAYSKTGSEDSAFFQDLRRHGARIVSAREAVVWEIVPENRVNMAYLKRRALRQGENYARVFLAPQTGLRSILSTLDAAAKTGLGGLTTLLTLPFGKGRYGPPLIRTIRNIGKLRYLAGISPIEVYKGQSS